jgi:Domain of unknown function (DUF5615)
MPFKFLIDECLSPELVGLAHAAGHLETTCVRDRGRAGAEDWALMPLVITGDFTLVTNNAKDFRGKTPGTLGGFHAKEEIHAGLVCLNTEIKNAMDIDKQRDLFELALAQLAGRPDLINQALEVTERRDGSVDVVFYAIPDN